MADQKAILDANILYPPFLRNAFLRLERIRLYQLYWTEDIIEELNRNILKIGLTKERVDTIINNINAAVPAALIKRSVYENLIDTMQNDPKDRHVLAAAVASQVKLIVTNNTKDFPKEVCGPLGVQIQSPDEFLLDQFKAQPDAVVQSFNLWLNDLKNPPLTLEELLAKLNNTAPNTVIAIKQYVKLP